MRRFIPDDSEHEVIPPQDWLPEFLGELDIKIYVNAAFWFRCRDKVIRSRSRVEALPSSEMGSPPPEAAIAGRANPAGIPFLYLSSDEVTCVAEKRVGIISHLAIELAQPLNPYASEIDYLPTQYLDELIRSQGYNGLVFNSAMGPAQNLVLFDPKKAIALSVGMFQVSNVQYSIE